MAQAVNEAEVVVVEPATPAAPEPEKRADVSDGKKGNDAATPSSNKMLVVGLIALLVCGTIGGVAAGIVVALDNDEGSSPPPPPPPIQPVGAGESVMRTVTSRMIVAGDVNSFNQEAFKNALAVSLTVQTRDISLSDVSSASVGVTAHVKTGADETETQRVTKQMNAIHNNPSQASLQNFTVESASSPTVEVEVVTTPPPQAIESITGSWQGEVSIAHLRDSPNMVWFTTNTYMVITQWGMTSSSSGWFVAKVEVMTSWLPSEGTWQRIEWTQGYDAGNPTKWAYCTVVYGVDTELEALNAEGDEHLMTGEANGNKCGNFGNTIMVTQDLEVAGSFASKWGANVVLTQYSASAPVYTPGDYLEMKVPSQGGYNQIMGYGKNFMFYYNGAGTYSPGTYSKIEWVANGTDVFYYCTTVFGASSLLAAFTKTPDPIAKNETHDICGAFTNTKWTRQKLSIVGEWTSDGGASATITTSTWATQDKWGNTSAKIIGYGPPKPTGEPMYLIKQYTQFDGYQAGVGKYNLDEYTMTEDANGPAWHACSTAYTKDDLEMIVSSDTTLLHVKNATHDKCGPFTNTKWVPA
mmetsp:Transcript_35182/g.60248  ORF Transcript_35182/g.60248 Transcript_35182/m.60248 type:complete len:581 (-) Transcript_35182:539-2281(-)